MRWVTRLRWVWTLSISVNCLRLVGIATAVLSLCSACAVPGDDALSCGQNCSEAAALRHSWSLVRDGAEPRLDEKSTLLVVSDAGQHRRISHGSSCDIDEILLRVSGLEGWVFTNSPKQTIDFIIQGESPSSPLVHRVLESSRLSEGIEESVPCARIGLVTVHDDATESMSGQDSYGIADKLAPLVIYLAARNDCSGIYEYRRGERVIDFLKRTCPKLPSQWQSLDALVSRRTGGGPWTYRVQCSGTTISCLPETLQDGDLIAFKPSFSVGPQDCKVEIAGEVLKPMLVDCDKMGILWDWSHVLPAGTPSTAYYYSWKGGLPDFLSHLTSQFRLHVSAPGVVFVPPVGNTWEEATDE